MIVIYGTGLYGEVDSYDGQRQLTRFVHIYYVPIAPVEAVWLTRDGRGHATKMNPRSVLAGYARIWGPIAAVLALVTGSAAGVIAAAALLLLSAWTWKWRSLRGARERRRSDFHIRTYGTRCDPLNMEEPLAASLQPRVAAAWAQVAGASTPDDVARLGATSPGQAMLAYASLRLAARLAPPDQARLAREASERILDAVRDEDPGELGGGPYRSARPQAHANRAAS